MSQHENELRQQPITIVLVDDHTMMREGTRRLLEEDVDLKVIGEAQDGDEALPLCRSLKPHVVVQGGRNSEIGQRLSITVKTVETHLTSIYGKLGVQSRAEAIALAQKQGLLLTASDEIG